MSVTNEVLGLTTTYYVLGVFRTYENIGVTNSLGIITPYDVLVAFRRYGDFCANRMHCNCHVGALPHVITKVLGVTSTNVVTMYA